MMLLLELALGMGVVCMLVILFLSGWMVGGRKRAQCVGEAYAGGKLMVRAADLARLRALRCEIEMDEGGLSSAAACLLFDVCEALRLAEGEMQHVIGPAYWLVLGAPVDGVNTIGEPLLGEWDEDDGEVWR